MLRSQASNGFKCGRFFNATLNFEAWSGTTYLSCLCTRRASVQRERCFIASTRLTTPGHMHVTRWSK